MARIELNIVALGDFKSVDSQIKNLRAQVELLNKSLTGTGLSSNLTKQLNEANAAFKASMLSTGQFTETTVKLKTETEKFGHALVSGKLKLSEYFSVIRGQSSAAAASMRALAVEQTKLQNSIVTADPTKKGVFSVYTPANLDAVANKTKIAANYQNLFNIAVDKGSQSLINWGKNTQWAGRQLTVGLTVPMAMFGSAAMKTFQQVNDELVKLQKVYGTGVTQPTKAALDEIKGQVVALSRELASSMGVAASDTAAMAAGLAATGQTGNDLIAATREAMRLARLGELDQQAAMQATVSLQNVYKLSTQDLTKSIDFLNAVENQTSTSLQDLVDGIPRVGPIVQQLGGSFKDTAVMMVAMKEAGVPAAQSANAIKSALASLINPSKNATEAFAAYNINLKNIASSTGGNPVQMFMELQKVMQGLEPLAKAQLIEKLFGKYQQARIQALVTNLGAVNSQTRTAFDLVNASAPQLAALAASEMKVATESTTGRFRRAVETIKADIIPLGEKIMEVATVLLKFGDSIAKAFGSLPGPVKTVLGVLAGASALVGPIIMLVGLMGNFAGYILKTVFNLKNLITGTKTFGELFTPEMIASQNAAQLFESKILQDVGAVDLLNQSVVQLVGNLSAMRGGMTTGVGSGVTSKIASAAQAGIQRSHLTENMNVNSKAAREAIAAAGLANISKDVKVSVVSNLVAELGLSSSSLSRKGVSTDKFAEAWFARTGKMYGSAISGGGKDFLNDPKMVAAVDKLEAEIGNRAISIAKGTAEQKVNDPILSRATKEVISEYKKLGGAEKAAALAFNEAAAQVGQVRRSMSAANIRAGLANGTLTKKGNDIFMGDVSVARVSSSNSGKFKTGNPFTPKGSYAKLRNIFSFDDAGIIDNAEKEKGSKILSDELVDIGDEAEKKASKKRALKFGAGMALVMGGQMLASALPQGSAASSVAGSASMGAGMGMMFGPQGALVGAIAGAAFGGLSSLMKAEKEHAATVKSTFTASASDVNFFGDKVFDTTLKINGMQTASTDLKDKLGSLTPEIQKFVEYVNSLGEKDPTKLFVNNLKDMDNLSAVTGSIRSKVTGAISTGGLDPANAKQYVMGLLAAAGKTKDFAAVWMAVSKSVVNSQTATIVSLNKMNKAAQNSGQSFFYNTQYANGLSRSYTDLNAVQKVFADGMLDLFSITSNGTLTFDQIKIRIAAIEKSSITASTGVAALSAAINNSGNKDAIARLEQIKAMYKNAGAEAQLTAGKIMMANLALQFTTPEQIQAWAGSKAGGSMRKASPVRQMEAYLKSKEFQDLYKVSQEIINPKTSNTNNGGALETGTAAQKKLLEQLKAKLSVEESEKKILDDKLKLEEKRTAEIKRQQDYLSQRTDLENQIRQSMATGDYLKANQLRQQMAFNTDQYVNEGKLSGDQAKSQTYTDRVDMIRNAIAELNDAMTNKKGTPKSATSALKASMPKLSAGSVSIPTIGSGSNYSYSVADALGGNSTSSYNISINIANAGSNVDVERAVTDALTKAGVVKKASASKTKVGNK